MPRLAPTRRRRALSAETAPAPEAAPDKQTLIEAHAKEWRSHHPATKLPIIVGIVVCTALVMTGWALTTGRGLLAPARPDAAFAAVSDSASVFTK